MHKMKGNCTVKIWINVFIILISVNFSRAQNLKIISGNSGAMNNSIATFQYNNVRYLSIDDFAARLNTHLYHNHQNNKTILYLGTSVIKITAFNPFIIVDQEVFQMPAESIYWNGQVCVPVHYFLSIIEQVVPKQIVYDRARDALIIYSAALKNISTVEIEEKTNGTLIRVLTLKDFDDSELSLRAGQGWLYLDIYGGKIDSSSLYAQYKKGMIAKVVASQVSADLAQIGFQLRDALVEKNLILQSSREVLISIKTKKDLSAEINTALERQKQKWLIDKIVIDPGHGGRDPGAIGKYGTKEKDVVLAIARYLKELIETESAIQVLMTREDDRFIELRHRTEFANRNQAKLFISIHANANANRKMRGVSTYFLGPGKTDEAREVANLENSVIRMENESRYADLTQENFILSAMAQNVYMKESQELADMVQNEVARTCGLRDIGVLQAGFYVLWGASMPNILIETAFISNADEERLLRSKSFQQNQALAIYRSVKKFIEGFNSGF